MKKVYLISLISVFALNLPAQIYWNKYPDNPVMQASPAGKWDEVLISPGTVLYQDSLYKMWYWGGDHAKRNFQIGYATSPDGINWTKDEINNPVLKSGTIGTWNENSVNVPSVLFRDSIYHMWFTGYTRTPRSFRMGRAISSNGVDWTRDTENNPVLDGGPEGSWDAFGAGDGTVVYDGDEYHMWYVSKKTISSSLNMGHATSPDGVIWTKDPLNPVMTPEESWESNRIDFPKVVFDGTVFHLWYSAGKSIGWGMGYAYSTDGSTWIKDDRNPVFEGTPGTWDEKSIIGYAIIDSAQIKYKMWYGGNDTDVDDSDIGYAFSDTRMPILFVTNIDLLDPTDTVFSEINMDGVIYIVPEGTARANDSITKNMLASVDVLAQTEAQILLADLSFGHYEIVAISSEGFVSANPFLFNLVENAKPPNLDSGIYAVTQGDTIFAASDKDGTIYLATEGTTPEYLIYPHRVKASSEVTADKQVGFSTADLIPGDYLIYAEDAYEQFSEASQVTVEGVGVGLIKSTDVSIRIFPNPAYDLLTIQTQDRRISLIEINSINGQRMYSDVMEGTSHQIDLSSFEKGVYLITIRFQDFVATKKIIKIGNQ